MRVANHAVATKQAHRLRLLVALMLCCVVSSCSKDESFELTLVLRDDLIVEPSVCTEGPEGACRLDFPEQFWRDETGGRAVVPARTLMVAYEGLGYGDHECGDRTLVQSYGALAKPLPPPDSDPYRLEFDDGSVLVLLEKEGTEASPFPIVDKCADYSGSWRGVSGPLDGLTGTFRTVNDSVQITMHLVAD
jgi:hypothetical protein